MSNTLTRSDICYSLVKEIGMSRKDSISLLETILNEVINNLATTGEVKITSFGTFVVRKKKERVGRNPRTGQEVIITPRNSLSFRASPLLKDKIR